MMVTENDISGKIGSHEYQRNELSWGFKENCLFYSTCILIVGYIFPKILFSTSDILFSSTHMSIVGVIESK